MIPYCIICLFWLNYLIRPIQMIGYHGFWQALTSPSSDFRQPYVYVGSILADVSMRQHPLLSFLKPPKASSLRLTDAEIYVRSFPKHMLAQPITTELLRYIHLPSRQLDTCLLRPISDWTFHIIAELDRQGADTAYLVYIPNFGRDHFLSKRLRLEKGGIFKGSIDSGKRAINSEKDPVKTQY